MCGYFAAKSIRIHVVDKGPLAVDLKHGEPLPVARLQSRIAVDLDLLKLERDLLPDLSNDLPRALAQVATLCVVEDDLRFVVLSHYAPRTTGLDRLRRRRHLMMIGLITFIIALVVELLVLGLFGAVGPLELLLALVVALAAAIIARRWGARRRSAVA